MKLLNGIAIKNRSEIVDPTKKVMPSKYNNSITLHSVSLKKLKDVEPKAAGILTRRKLVRNVSNGQAKPQ